MDDGFDIDWGAERQQLAVRAQIDADWYRAVVSRVSSADDHLVLDVGCGAAGMSIAVASLSDSVRIIALDGDESVLATARDNVAATVGEKRVEFRQCDLHGGLDALRTAVPEPADLIWASGVIHHMGDQQPAIDALASLLAEGGRLALAEDGLEPRHLPWDVGTGDPGLEVRLDAAENIWFTQMRTRLPGHVPMTYGWTEALLRAGLANVTTWNFLIDRPAPLPAADHAAVIDELRQRVGRMRDVGLLSDDDTSAWEQLLAPDGTTLRGRTDLFRLAVRSVHVGTK